MDVLGGFEDCTGAGPGATGLIGDSGAEGATVAPALFTVLKVVPGGVCGGRLSMIKLLWFTTSRVAAEAAATISATITGFRKTISIPVNGDMSLEVPALGRLPDRQKGRRSNRLPAALLQRSADGTEVGLELGADAVAAVIIAIALLLRRRRLALFPVLHALLI